MYQHGRTVDKRTGATLSKHMQFKIGQTVVRLDPGNHEVPFSIQNESDVKYHTDLATRGYTYTDITRVKASELFNMKDTFDFALPDVPVSKLTVHRASTDNDLCISCQ